MRFSVLFVLKYFLKKGLSFVRPVISPFHISCPPSESSSERSEYQIISFLQLLLIIPKGQRQGGRRRVSITLNVQQVYTSFGQKKKLKNIKCGKDMDEGYYIDNGLEYYCSDECLHKHYTEEEYEEMYDDSNGYSYWTEWED